MVNAVVPCQSDTSAGSVHSLLESISRISSWLYGPSAEVIVSTHAGCAPSHLINVFVPSIEYRSVSADVSSTSSKLILLTSAALMIR